MLESLDALLSRSIWVTAHNAVATSSQLRAFTAMCIAMLGAHRLIDPSGVPVGLCSLVARLSYIAPANFFLVRLFQNDGWAELIGNKWTLLDANHEQLLSLEGHQTRGKSKRIIYLFILHCDWI